MSKIRPYVLSIAGYDPSGGSGVLADIKTFEAHQTYGLGVCTAQTFQNDRKFENVEWIEQSKIIRQIEMLNNVFHYDYVKIGLIENLAVLENIVDYLLEENPDVKIIWDPILKASSGYIFHEKINEEIFLFLMGKIFLITPNMDEAKILFKSINLKKNPELLLDRINIEKLSAILLKGGHDEGIKVTDILFVKNQVTSFEGIRYEKKDKHGTGCVLSSAITANLAKGYELVEACKNAKNYINEFISSNKTLLGYHSFN